MIDFSFFGEEILLDIRVIGCGLWWGKGRGKVRGRVKLFISFYVEKLVVGIGFLWGWEFG